jgi:hypothetical protein
MAPCSTLHGAERRPQPHRVLLDRRHARVLEHARKHLLHHHPVLEHVGDTGWCSNVVLEHDEGARGIADQVDPGDVDVHATGRHHAAHLRPVALCARHEGLRDDPFAQDPLLSVDVGEEGVERADPLDQTALDPVPLGARHDARNRIEGEDALCAALVGVDGEGDATAEEGAVRELATRAELPLTDRIEQLDDATRLRANLAFAAVELVEGSRERLVGPEDRLAPRSRGLTLELLLPEHGPPCRERSAADALRVWSSAQDPANRLAPAAPLLRSGRDVTTPVSGLARDASARTTRREGR